MGGIRDMGLRLAGYSKNYCKFASQSDRQIKSAIMRRFIIAIFFLAVIAYARAQFVEFANEKADTAKITAMMGEVLAAKPASPGDAVLQFGLKFVGVPYKGGTLEGDPEKLRVNIDSVDCTTFVEMMMALAMTVDQRRHTWRDFAFNLQKLRYRGGEINGYPSRLHYICDWAIDNTHRGNITDVTTTFPRYGYIVKSIDFMSANADRYPALKDSASHAGIKNVEIGYRNHRFPYLKANDTASKDMMAGFRNGDIVAFTTKLKNLDVTHMGIIMLKNGEPYVLHASSSAGKVVVSDKPLAAFLKRNTSMNGVRVFRLNRY